MTAVTPPSREKFRPKGTHEERAVRLKQKSIELRTRGLLIKVVNCLTTHPWALQGVAEHLRDVGALGQDLNITKAKDEGKPASGRAGEKRVR